MNKLILILSCITAVIADMLFVWYAKKVDHPVHIAVTGLFLANISICVWSYSMREGIESSMAITMYCLLTMIGCTILGYFVFKEDLTLLNWIGIGLAIVAILFISIKK